MDSFINIINVIGILGTVLISTITLFATRSLQHAQQKATIMATKRSERIDLMRQYSAGLISCGKHLLYGIGSPETKAELICYTDQFISLLQYAYPHDVELIDCANAIVRLSLEAIPDKEALEKTLHRFWEMCDIYVGVEYERLKVESMGDINGSGKINKESNTFEDIYTVLKAQQQKFTSQKVLRQ